MILSNYATGWLAFQLSQSKADRDKLAKELGYAINSPGVEEYMVETKLLLEERIEWLERVLALPTWTHYPAALYLKVAQAIDPLV